MYNFIFPSFLVADYTLHNKISTYIYAIFLFSRLFNRYLSVGTEFIMTNYYIII